MSAFALVYERSNTLADPGVLERIMSKLPHRGPDGCDTYLAGSLVLGHWHFWTTPEEWGEKQPLTIPGLPFKIVLDGRLDNRPELLAELGMNTLEGGQLSDATLMLHAYERWTESCFEHFIGPFAVAIWDESRSQLLIARDALGDRTLFYSNDGQRLLVASEPWAIACALRQGIQLDEVSVAHYFAFKAPEDGRTLYKHIQELLPAQVILVQVETQRTWFYWQANLSKIYGRSDMECTEQFLALLEQSVYSRLRSKTPVGVQMSGGLDSPSVACLAARRLSPQPLTTISYIYDELAECDERNYIETVIARWGIRSIQIPCDDAWPLRDWTSWPSNPNHPEGHLYRQLAERAYACAHQEGQRVLLTGDFGDHLYGEANGWLADLLTEGRLREAGKDLALHLRHTGLRKTITAGYTRQALKRALASLTGGKRFYRNNQQLTLPWLSPYAISALPLPDPLHDRQGGMLGLRTAQNCSRETYHASRHGLELRYPYRDRRLVEFVLTLPAHQYYRHGMYKHILRSAMCDILPEMIRTRIQPTSVRSLFLRGMEHEKNKLEECIQNPVAKWQKFFRTDWLFSKQLWTEVFSPKPIGSTSLVPWLCISFDAWYQSVFIV